MAYGDIIDPSIGQSLAPPRFDEQGFPTNPPLGPSLGQGQPPASPEELQQRAGGWMQFFERLRTDPPLTQAFMTLGAQMLQPIQPGQTAGGVAANALQQSINVLGARRAQEGRQAIAQERTDVQREGLDVRREELAEGRAQSERQHRERMAAIAASRQERAPSYAGIVKDALESVQIMIEVNPTIVSDQAGNIDPVKMQVFETYEINRRLMQSGLEPRNYMPFTQQDVDDAARQSQTDPRAFARQRFVDEILHGPQFLRAVEQRMGTLPAQPQPGPSSAPTAPARPAFTGGGVPTDVRPGALEISKANEIIGVIEGQGVENFVRGAAGAAAQFGGNPAQDAISRIEPALQYMSPGERAGAEQILRQLRQLIK